MSLFILSLQVFGPFQTLERVASLVTQHPVTLRRAGERIGRSSMVATSDVLDVKFGEWECDQYGDEEASFAKAQAVLEAARLELLRLAATLASIDRSEVEARLWLSAIRMEEQGGLSLPPQLIAATAEAGLGLEISILVMLADEGGESRADIAPRTRET